MALWTPNDESGLIAWFDMTDPDSYDSGAKTWDARWGSLQCISSSGAGPTKISTGFSGNKNALVFTGNSDTDLKILNPGFTELMYVTVFNVTTISIGMDIPLWSRTGGLGQSGLNVIETYGMQAKYLQGGTHDAEVWDRTWPGSAIVVSLHTKAERSLRLNGSAISSNTTVTTGTEPASSDEFLICPYPGGENWTIQLAAIGLFDPADWSEELAERIEGFLAHNNIGLTASILPGGHTYKSTAPTTGGENVEVVQTLSDFNQTVTVGPVGTAVVSQTMENFSQSFTWGVENDVNVSQTLADFSQSVLLGDDPVVTVSQTLDDFQQTLTLTDNPVIIISQVLGDFSASAKFQNAVGAPTPPEYNTISCGPGYMGTPVKSGVRTEKREFNYKWPTR